MLIVPDARAAILRSAFVAALSISCIVWAVRIDRRWARILLAVLAVPLTLLAVYGLFVVSLIMRYGPR
jgi:hypothetical protein